LINDKTLKLGSSRLWGGLCGSAKEAVLLHLSGSTVAMTARFRLKAATAAAHERLDACMSRYDLGCRVDYGAFLQAQARAFIGVEAALDAACADTYLPDWRERRRSDALRADLGLLGLDVPEPALVPTFREEAELLGAIYVLEGSRLGAAVLVCSPAITTPRDAPPSSAARSANCSLRCSP